MFCMISCNFVGLDLDLESQSLIMSSLRSVVILGKVGSGKRTLGNHSTIHSSSGARMNHGGYESSVTVGELWHSSIG